MYIWGMKAGTELNTMNTDFKRNSVFIRSCLPTKLQHMCICGKRKPDKKNIFQFDFFFLIYCPISDSLKVTILPPSTTFIFIPMISSNPQSIPKDHRSEDCRSGKVVSGEGSETGPALCLQGYHSHRLQTLAQEA